MTAKNGIIAKNFSLIALLLFSSLFPKGANAENKEEWTLAGFGERVLTFVDKMSISQNTAWTLTVMNSGISIPSKPSYLLTKSEFNCSEKSFRDIVSQEYDLSGKAVGVRIDNRYSDFEHSFPNSIGRETLDTFCNFISGKPVNGEIKKLKDGEELAIYDGIGWIKYEGFNAYRFSEMKKAVWWAKALLKIEKQEKAKLKTKPKSKKKKQ